MLRHGTQGTLAAGGSSSLHPRHFVCGLARALDVEEERAVTIVHAAVASHVRSLLLSVSASKRTGDTTRASKDLLSIVSSVRMYPMPASAPEAEAVASAVRDKVTTAELEEILKELATEAPEMAELFTVMLGFDVNLTLPMLKQMIPSIDTDGLESH